MTESERARALKEVQFELFDLDRRYVAGVTTFSQFQVKKQEILTRQKLLLLSGTKCCRKCRAVKGVREFYREDRYADGRRPYCIGCYGERMRRYNELKRKKNVLSRGAVA